MKNLHQISIERQNLLISAEKSSNNFTPNSKVHLSRDITSKSRPFSQFLYLVAVSIYLNYLFIQFSFLYLSRLIYLGIFLDGQCC
jgi:hypothetical protein